MSEGLRHITRNGKANADAAAAWRQNRGVDTNQLAVQVQQRAAGITSVNRGIGLDKVLQPFKVQTAATECGNNAGCGGLPEAKWITDGHGEIANAKFIGIGDRDLRQMAGVL